MQKASTYLNLILTSWNQSGKMSYKNYFLSDKLTEICDEDDYMRLNMWVNCTTKNEREWDLCSQSRKTTRLATKEQNCEQVQRISLFSSFFADPLPASPHILFIPEAHVCLLTCSISLLGKWKGHFSNASSWFVLLSHFSSGMDILITTTDYRKLTQESKELLCAACEMAQLRCAKLINVRGKVRAWTV